MDQLQEKYILKALKELYTNFPNGKIIHDDCPDFIIDVDNKTIGIEITQIFIDSHLDTGLNEKRKESLRCKLGDGLCEKLESIVPFKFLLSIDYSLKDFSNNKISPIISVCADYLRQLNFSSENVVSIDIDNFGQLPEEIDSLNLFKFPSLSKSSYVETAGGCVPNLTNQYLQIALDKKNAALKKYKFCDEYWLLIEEGTYHSDSFDAIELGEIHTDFEKVSLYRHSRKEIITLK